tara:strand:- start:650 stop:853 length:204 start_codon:yes stop_codon:yes gene_type:complete
MDADWKKELADAEVEIRGLDRSYAMLYLARMDSAANQAIATLPKKMHRPFLEVMSICQTCYGVLRDE